MPPVTEPPKPVEAVNSWEQPISPVQPMGAPVPPVPEGPKPVEPVNINNNDVSNMFVTGINNQ